MPEPATFWGLVWCTDFGVSIVGNLLASLGYEGGGHAARASFLQLRALIGSGVSQGNHDLLRALWTAQNEALALACEWVLREEKRLRPGALAVPVDLSDLEAWRKGLPGVDAEARALLRLRAESLRLARRAGTDDLAPLLPRMAAAVADAPELLLSGSEFATVEAAALRDRLLDRFLPALAAAHPGLPPALEACLRARWFDFVRVAFREVLKRNDHARRAFEFHVWERIEGLPESLDTALRRLESLDGTLDTVLRQVRWLAEAVEAVVEGVNRQHAQGRADLEALGEALLRDARVRATEAGVATAMETLRQRIDFLDTRFAVLPQLARSRPGPGERLEAHLLNPESRSVPLLGRDAEFADLWAWVHSDMPVSIRVIGMEAGAGKTRIGFEVLLALESARNGGPGTQRGPAALRPWCIGRVRAETLLSFGSTRDWEAWDWDRPTVLLVDYALDALPALKSWLPRIARAAAQRAPDSPLPALRLLLLEREGSAKHLLRELAAVVPDHDWFRPSTEPFPLRRLTGAGDRRAILDGALKAMAAARGRPVPALPAAMAAEVDRRLMEDPAGQPLYLLMIAWEIVDGTDPATAFRLGRSGLVKRAARRERERLQRRGGTDPGTGRLHAHLGACATLVGGWSADEAIRAASGEMEALGYTGLVPPGRAAEELHAALGEEGRYVGPVRPDLVGERLIFDLLEGLPDDAARLGLLTRMVRFGPERAFPVLMRTAADLPQAEAAQFEAWMESLVRRWAEAEPALVAAFDEALPFFSVALLGVSVVAAECLVAKARAEAHGSSDPACSSRLARRLHRWGFRLSHAGRLADALQPTVEAVGIRRGLAHGNPAAFGPDLASTLNNLGNCLSALGRHAEALQSAEEAVSIRRELAQVNPASYGPDLAGSLNNLGCLLSALGRHADALQSTEEAVNSYRLLAQGNPAAHGPDLAMSLDSLGTRLSNLGRQADALQSTEEAVSIRRALAQVNPASYGPDLAGSLNNLGCLLSNLGRLADALQPTEEAVRIWRELAQGNSAAYGSDLAGSLNNLGILLSDLGRHADALQSTEEAVSIQRVLAQGNPAAYGSDLAVSLNNLGNRLSHLGRDADALQPTEEAVSIQRVLAQGNPAAFGPDLARSLNNLGIRLSHLGRHADALPPTGEAVNAYRKLAQGNPAAFGPRLANALRNQGTILEADERPDAAFACLAEAIEILTPHLLALPEAHAPRMLGMAADYRRLAAALGRDGDPDLLQPVEDAIQRLASGCGG